MAESTLILNRWTPTRKAAVVLELLRGSSLMQWSIGQNPPVRTLTSLLIAL